MSLRTFTFEVQPLFPENFPLPKLKLHPSNSNSPFLLSLALAYTILLMVFMKLTSLGTSAIESYSIHPSLFYLA